MSFSRMQLGLLALLTVVWGLNWPVMKLGVSGEFPPLFFRTLSLWLGLPVLALGLVWLRIPFAIPRPYWGELLRLALFNMFIWHGLSDAHAFFLDDCDDSSGDDVTDSRLGARCIAHAFFG